LTATSSLLATSPLRTAPEPRLAMARRNLFSLGVSRSIHRRGQEGSEALRLKSTMGSWRCCILCMAIMSALSSFGRKHGSSSMSKATGILRSAAASATATNKLGRSLSKSPLSAIPFSGSMSRPIWISPDPEEPALLQGFSLDQLIRVEESRRQASSKAHF
jgi:hypothetical protein